jgi:hypothetical protein
MATATRSRKAPAKTAAPAPKRTSRAKTTTAPPAKTAKAAPAAKRGRPKASADKKNITWLQEHLESNHGIEADGTKIRQVLRQLVKDGALPEREGGTTYEFTGLKDPQVVELIKKLKSPGRKKAAGAAPKRGRKKAEPVEEVDEDVEDLDDEEEYEDEDADEELEDDEEYEDEDEDLDDE